MSEAAADPVSDLNARAQRAVAARDLAGARELLEQALAQDGADPAGWLRLAAVRRGLGDPQGAMAAVDRALALEPRAFPALLMRASLLERLGATRPAAAAYEIALTQAPPDEALDPATRAAAARAREIAGARTAELQATLKGVARGIGASPPALRQAEAFVDFSLRARRRFHQEPTNFFHPGLPEIEFWNGAEFPWLERLEAASPAIAAELAGLMRGDEGLEPYVAYPDGVPLDQWAELNRSPRWSAFHLLRGGAPVMANAARCPATIAALAEVDHPTVQDRSPAAMFSVLRPHTRIPPHTGVANTRLVCHLPLVVPPGCGFRVGAETREWRAGEAFVFDDTIEHEAWNDGDQVRVVLICDVWNPRLSDEQRALVAAIMAALDAYEGGAPVSDL